MRQLFQLASHYGRQFRLILILLTAGWLISVTGCRTAAPLAAVDFSQGSWKIKSGQAVWRVNREAPEIAGEILFAHNEEGRIVLQMTKTPFPMVLAQLHGNCWQIEFPSETKTYSGRGTPPKRLAWLHLANALNGNPIASSWHFEWLDKSAWRMEDQRTGETIEGFLE